MTATRRGFPNRLRFDSILLGTTAQQARMFGLDTQNPTCHQTLRLRLPALYAPLRE